jgi:UDP-4-amino-4,6-dideoxy-N-acetyl-beta-L-altrosamine N-acetyltransferase
MKPLPRLETSRLCLVGIDATITNEIVRWRNDPEVTRWLFSSSGLTVEEHQAWLTRYAENAARHEFIICLRDTETPIGTVGLSRIDPAHGSAEIGIMLGELHTRGKGYAREAVMAVTAYAFDRISLNSVYARIIEGNLASRMLFERAGYRYEGYWPFDMEQNGQYVAVVCYAAQVGEWGALLCRQ